MKSLRFILICSVLFFIIFPLFMMTKYSVSDRESIVTGGKYPEPFFPFKPNLEMFEALSARKDFVGVSRFRAWLFFFSFYCP
jgi:ABC-type glycerol-3-phosphate transport system permease component